MPRAFTHRRSDSLPEILCEIAKTRYAVTEIRSNVTRLLTNMAWMSGHVFFAGLSSTFEGDRTDYGKSRLITLGVVMSRVFVIDHTPRSCDPFWHVDM